MTELARGWIERVLWDCQGRQSNEDIALLVSAYTGERVAAADVAALRSHVQPSSGLILEGGDLI